MYETRIQRRRSYMAFSLYAVSLMRGIGMHCSVNYKYSQLLPSWAWPDLRVLAVRVKPVPGFVAI